jgi:hypothetical protein
MTDQEMPRNANEILATATPEQVRWVIARLSAKSDQEAAKAVKVHPTTVCKWPNKSDLDRAVNLLLQDVAGATALILRQAAPEAARALRESLRDPKMRVSAATAVLDRTGFAARQQHEVDISDALAGVLERLADQGGTADD